MKTVLALVVHTGYAADRPWMNTADPPEERARKLVKEMTTEEKLSLFHGSCGGYTGNVCGIDRLGIPQQKFNDGPQGFRGAAGTSTSWPGAMTVSAAFDDNLAREYGEVMGDEFYRKGANVQLGPGVCIARVPQNGRNFEYLSGEDPYLGYRLSKQVITGIQSQGVIANAKHYVNNNQETQRGSFTANVDERTQWEIYYPPFKGAIDAGLGSIMCSYNKECVDCPPEQIGNWSCENHRSLTEDLKGKMGFKGWVMSDWGGTHSTSMNAGLDQEMPGSKYMGQDLANMVASGDVDMNHVDDSAWRILWPYFKMGLFDKPNTNTKDNNVTSEEHNAKARELSAKGTVLLKNEGILPLGANAKNIAVIGSKAVSPIVHGGGSGAVTPTLVSAPLDAIRARFGIAPPPPVPNNCSNGIWEKDTDYYNQHSQSSAHASSVEECCSLCGARGGCNAFTFVGGTCWMKADDSGRRAKSGALSGICHKGKQPVGDECNGDYCVHFDDGSDVDSAAKLAATADAVLIFVGTSSSEGGDRRDLTLASEDALIQAVSASAGDRVTVVAVTPGALLTPWRDTVGAILVPFMPGQEFGNAITDVIFGDHNPSAKLPITFPKEENDIGMTQEQYPGKNGVSIYSEGLEVGYRWYAAHAVVPAFPFGHGLSYSTFKYSNLQVDGRTISCKIKNTGAVDGAEVAQLYLGFPQEAGEPPKQLKGFEKVNISAGKSKTVTFSLDDTSFSIWDTKVHDWAVVPGDFKVMVGSSSDDIRLTSTVSSESLVTV